VPATLRVIGESAAGHRFSGSVGAGEAVRIFTGAPLPAGADTILIQENADRDGDHVVARQSEPRGRFVREAGYDFHHGDALLKAGLRLGPRHLALAAAMNYPEMAVRRRPRVALLATGDELARPGQALGPDQIVTSNNFAVAGMVTEAGAEPLDLGIAADTPDALEQGLARARAARADIFVTLGGASVGDHDLVQRVLQPQGLALDFWKIAMRPGKPLMFGRLDRLLFLGLPGNPVSAIVCAHLFLRPLVRKLLGDPRAGEEAPETARLGRDLPANDERQDYLRATLASEGDALVATPFSRQDSGMVATLARADALVVRAPHARAARAGDACRIIRL
jgi:molybdopterin molybdotransferase